VSDPLSKERIADALDVITRWSDDADISQVTVATVSALIAEREGLLAVAEAAQDVRIADRSEALQRALDAWKAGKP